MKLNPVLRMRSWIAKIHPPMLPARDNKQLITLLKSSFQKRLDEDHPPPSKAVHSTGQKQGLYWDDSSTKATIDHLEALLQHPLLAQTPGTAPEQSHAAAAVGYLDQAMRRGDASLEILGRALAMFAKSRQKNARLGNKIVEWYRCADNTTKTSFLTSEDILSQAVPVMYAENLEPVVWEWLARLYSRGDGATMTSTSRHEQEWSLVYLMVKGSSRKQGLIAGVQHFVQACEHMQSAGVSQVAPVAWLRTARLIRDRICQRNGHHGMKAELYDEFLRYQSMFVEEVSMAGEMMWVYHPTKPTAENLVAALRRKEAWIGKEMESLRIRNDGTKERMLGYWLQAAQLLSEQGTSKETAMVLDFLDKHYPPLHNALRNAHAQRQIQTARHTLPVLHLALT